jgi:hypothetical protein
MGLGLELRASHLQSRCCTLEPHLQSVLLWLFWKWGLSVCLGWPWTLTLWISAFQVARITSKSHQCLALAGMYTQDKDIAERLLSRAIENSDSNRRPSFCGSKPLALFSTWISLFFTTLMKHPKQANFKNRRGSFSSTQSSWLCGQPLLALSLHVEWHW